VARAASSWRPTITPTSTRVLKEHIRFHDKTRQSKGITLSINVIRPELIEPASRKAVMGRGRSS
jgi:hypothetical protein